MFAKLRLFRLTDLLGAAFVLAQAPFALEDHRSQGEELVFPVPEFLGHGIDRIDQRSHLVGRVHILYPVEIPL